MEANQTNPHHRPGADGPGPDARPAPDAMVGERGATAIEYALIAGLIALVIIGGVTLLGENTLGLYDKVANGVQ